MRSIHILNSLLQLTFYGLIVSVIPISKASHIDSATKACPNWVDCLRAQKKEAPLENRIADNIAQNGSKCGKWVTFPNKIVAIALKKVGAWEKPEALFASQDFIAMYKHPAYYWKHAIDYLANPIYPEEYKKIAIYGLENLGYTHYLAFAEACYKLYQANQLSEPLFQMVLGFEFLHIHPLVMGSIAKRHHKDSDIKAFLKKVDSNVEKDSLIRPLITEIVSGRFRKRMGEKEKKRLSRL